MCGALAVFDECRVTLVGGHSSEGHELALGFTVGGSSNQALLSKDALRKWSISGNHQVTWNWCSFGGFNARPSIR